MFCAGSGECCSKEEQDLNNDPGSVPSGVRVFAPCTELLRISAFLASPPSQAHCRGAPWAFILICVGYSSELGSEGSRLEDVFRCGKFQSARVLGMNDFQSSFTSIDLLPSGPWGKWTRCRRALNRCLHASASR